MKSETKENIEKLHSEIIKDLGEKTDMDVLKSMKKVLDTSFGEQHNQIFKTSVKEAIDYIKILCDNSGRDIDEISDTNLKKWLLHKKYYALIHFPEFEIKNSKGGSSIIKDLYVKFEFDEKGRFISSISGTRTTFSLAEAKATYVHSHLQHCSVSEMRFNPFCTGIGPINQVISLLRTDYSDINFTLFCLHLKSYIKWESIEYGPHAYISEIQSGESSMIQLMNNLNTERINFVCNKLMDFIKGFSTEEFKKYFQISVNERGVFVKANEILEEDLTYFVKDINFSREKDYILKTTTSTYLLAGKDTLGNYYTIESTNTSIGDIMSTPVLNFKKEDKYLVIEKEGELKQKQYVNPHITAELCWRISRELSKTAVETV